MKITVAIDSFKGSITSVQAGEAVRRGIRRADPDVQVTVRPLADGGEGTVESLIAGMGGSRQQVTVSGPLGKTVTCGYGVLEKDGKARTAIIEMASAAGITLVPPEKRNPMETTTYGVGEMIRDAIQKGCRNFLIGIGGSATNDGGIGMLQALGFGFLDKDGKPVPAGACGLEKLERITDDTVMPELLECRFRVACDVVNPLCGDQGCSAVFGPQKGADPEIIRYMDQWMARYAQLAKTVCPDADGNQPGSGAAGGLGFAFRTFLNASLEPGIQIVIEETGLEDEIRDADLVITGEGKLDAQTVMGKAPAGVAGLAKKYGKPVIAFCGAVGEGADRCNAHGIDAYFPIVRGVTTLEEAMNPEWAAKNLADTAEQVYRLIGAASVLSHCLSDK